MALSPEAKDDLLPPDGDLEEDLIAPGAEEFSIVLVNTDVKEALFLPHIAD